MVKRALERIRLCKKRQALYFYVTFVMYDFQHMAVLYFEYILFYPFSLNRFLSIVRLQFAVLLSLHWA